MKTNHGALLREIDRLTARVQELESALVARKETRCVVHKPDHLAACCPICLKERAARIEQLEAVVKAARMLLSSSESAARALIEDCKSTMHHNVGGMIVRDRNRLTEAIATLDNTESTGWDADDKLIADNAALLAALRAIVGEDENQHIHLTVEKLEAAYKAIKQAKEEK